MNNQDVKFLEIRDVGTTIGVMCVATVSTKDPILNKFMWHAGFGPSQAEIIIVKLDGCEAHYDRHLWNPGSRIRTMQAAHHYIKAHWNELKSGDVVDVEFNNGETVNQKAPEIWKPNNV